MNKRFKGGISPALVFLMSIGYTPMTYWNARIFCVIQVIFKYLKYFKIILYPIDIFSVLWYYDTSQNERA